MILLFQERGGDASLDFLKILATFRRDSAIGPDGTYLTKLSRNPVVSRCTEKPPREIYLIALDNAVLHNPPDL